MTDLMRPGRKAQSGPRLVRAPHDIMAIGIAVAAIIMFVGTGSSVLPQIWRAFSGQGPGPDRQLINALLLNIALVIFGWRRYNDFVTEIAMRRKAEEQAHSLARIDPLTGCLNRRSIGEATDRLVADAHARGEEVAFLMVDLDNFKHVNDVYGHTAGDAILQEIANRITAAMPQGSLVARLGGDEFGCAIPFAPARANCIEKLASQLIQIAVWPVTVGDLELETSISMGITRSAGNTAADPSRRLLHMADIAMYHAKKKGRNRYFWFEESMESELRFRAELESGIRRGVSLGEFVPHYEQQIDLNSGKLTGFEMLARWNSPTLGAINPDIFIPVAEEIGIIGELSESVMTQALKEARNWDPSLTLSVNISPIQLRDPWFAQKLLKLLVEANFPPSRLDIEITESCLHENLGDVRSLIASLKNQGISISLDDFGAGYSSLSQLRSLPFDRIKIDRSFVSGLSGSGDSTAIMQAITALAEGLGLPITAEGIDSEAIQSQLMQLGAFKGQGFLYGQPETGHETRERLSLLGLLLVDPETSDPGAEIAAPLDANRRSA